MLMFHQGVKCAGIVMACAGALSGCALTGGLFGTLGPDYRPENAAPSAWQAPLAHGGSAEALAQWWSRFEDPLLVELQASAQRASADLAQAAARIAQARADAVAAGAAGSPSLDANAGINRAAFTFGGPAVLRSQVTVGLQSSWEIDLMGGLSRQRQAAQARVEGGVASWHEARVALAAEVANAYVNLRFCEMRVALAKADVASRAETARLTGIAAAAGLQAPATLALAKASAADGAATVTQRAAECEVGIKGLVALTAMDEPTLRARLAALPALTARLPKPAGFAIASVPAGLLAQRPDVARAEREVAAASADIGVAEADRYPRLRLAGDVTPSRTRFGSAPSFNVTTWSIGPSVTLPLVDGGRRAATAEAARVQYEAAASAYRAKARQAVREVEEALVNLGAVAARRTDVEAAAAGYRQSMEAVRVRERAGLASLIELEDARRTSLNADAAVAALEYEGVNAWIGLYRATGGGWDGALDPATARATPNR
jgi:NodT family efflux transporter outer membrane factor (OMF) lipoprotein